VDTPAQASPGKNIVHDVTLDVPATETTVEDTESLSIEGALAMLEPDTASEPETPSQPTAPTKPSTSNPAVAHSDAIANSAGADMIRAELPGLLELLLAKAKAGDVLAAAACVRHLEMGGQLLPAHVVTDGALGPLIKGVMTAMAKGEIPPGQALDTLRAVQTAQELLKKS